MALEARKLDISDEQILEMEQDSGFNVKDVKEIQDARSEIIKEIETSTDLKLAQKKELVGKFNKETSKTDITKILGFRKNINEAISESLDETYEKRVSESKDAFAVDEKRGLDTAKDFVTEFKNLSLDKKREWLEQLDHEIEKRVTLREQLKKEVPELDDSALQKLRRSEMQSLIDNLSDAENFLKKNEKYFSEEERNELKERMADSSKTDQLKIFAEAVKSLRKREELHDIFSKLPAEFIRTAGDFSEQSLTEKEQSVDRVREDMKGVYKFKYAKACEAGYMNQRSADEAYGYFKNAEMLGKYGMIESIKNLDKQLGDEQKLQKEFQKVMKDLEKHLTPQEASTLEHKFQMATYVEKQEDLIPEVKDLLKEKLHEESNENLRTEKYKEALTDAQNKGYISKRTMSLSLRLWKNGDQNYKDETFDPKKPDVFAEKLQPYIDAHKDFHETMALVKNGKLMSEKAVSDKTVEFSMAGLEKKGKIILELHRLTKDVKEKTEDQPKATNNNNKPENENTPETSETEKKITQLTMQAMQAERRKDYQQAYDNYLEILDLAPHDRIAKRNADHLAKLLEQNNQETTNPEDDSLQQAQVEQMIKETEKQADVQNALEETTLLETFAEEVEGSETVSNTTKAVNRGNRSGELERAVAKKLGKDGFQLQKDGTAEEIVTINSDETISKAQKAQLKRTAHDEIIRSADPNYMENIQFKDRNGKEVSSAQAFAKIEQDKDKIRKTIKQRTIAKGLKKAGKTDSPNNLADLIDEELENRKLKVDLTT